MSDEKLLGVLFVDDEKDILELLEEDVAPLKDKFRFYFETDPTRAVELVKGGNVQIIVADYSMRPINGIEMLKQIRSIDPNIVRLVLTSYGDEQTTHSFIDEVSVMGLISKPWDKPFLYSHLLMGRDEYFKKQAERGWGVIIAAWQDGLIRIKSTTLTQEQSREISDMVFLANVDLYDADDTFHPIDYTLPLPYLKCSAQVYMRKVDSEVIAVIVKADKVLNLDVGTIDVAVGKYIDHLEGMELAGLAESILPHLTYE